MKREAEANADSDKKLKEEAESMNKADQLIFQPEKQLKEYGDKLPADKKEPIETALAELKKVHEAKDVPAIEPAVAKLQGVLQGMYEAMQNAQQQGAPNEGPQGGEEKKGDGEVQDVDFEEVKDEKK